MEVKLKVLGGAKAGLEIPLKKEVFTIGRSSECSLRAGSDAISRKHCVIRLGKSSIKIADLKSRNGTFVNGERIEQETALASGDEVRVGPLRFEVLAEHGLDTRKRPHVQGVAEAAARSAGQAGKDRSLEDDIGDWLTEPASESQVLHETRSLRLDETQGGQVPADAPAEEGDVSQAENILDDKEDEVSQAESVLEEEHAPASDPAGETAGSDSSLKRKDKQEPGKLPSRPKGPSTKDSREAAAEVLRAMTRRR